MKRVEREYKSLKEKKEAEGDTIVSGKTEERVGREEERESTGESEG